MTAPWIIPSSPSPSMVGSAPSFYKRPLPIQCTAFNSTQGKQFFQHSMQEGHLDTYFALAGQFLTQNEPAFCGLGTLAMTLNSLEVDPQRKWKGPWRWYAEELLDCCRPLEQVRQVGITLNEFACLARCNGLKATIVSPYVGQDEHKKRQGLEQFRRDLRKATNGGRDVMALSFSRKTLGQTGDGHFSPIGAYSEQDDAVLVLDVARFKYPSYWISVELAYDSMLPIDKATGQSRGYCMLSPLPETDPGSITGPLSLTTLTLNKSTWASLSSSLQKVILSLPRSSNATDLIKSLTTHLNSYPTSPVSPRPTTSTTTDELSSKLLPQLDKSMLSQLVKQILTTERQTSTTRDQLTPLFLMALLSTKSSLSHFVPSHVKNELSTLFNQALHASTNESDVVATEVEFLTRQLNALGECCRAEESEGQNVSCGCAGPTKEPNVVQQANKCH
ncbi:hypothetical protein OIO90_001010 [Microbotryomycetes sp. JL221]|nr:hypothetical protein OIO90_001010 [Microbotryomycetes sp. JL221]